MIDGVIINNIELTENEVLCIYFCSGECVAINCHDRLFPIKNNIVKIYKNPYDTLKDFRNEMIIFDCREVSHIIVKKRVE